MLFQNVSSLWVFCQTGLIHNVLSKCVQHVSVPKFLLNWTPFSKCVQYVSVIWNFLPNWTDSQCPLKNVSRKWVFQKFILNWTPSLNVSSLWVCCGLFCQTGLDDSAHLNVFSMWVCPEISCHTGLADSALLKCVQEVSVLKFLSNWQGPLKICLGSECSGISYQTGLADSALPKCVQFVNVFQDFLSNWTGWQVSLKMWPESECPRVFC